MIENIEDATADDRVLGIIYTTEPIAMRGLASELRHNRSITENICSELVGAELGHLQMIRCEDSKSEQLDLVLLFQNGTVGIEGKIGHVVTSEQLDREKSAVDHLIVLVKEEADVAPAQRKTGVVVATWGSVLSRFPESRLTLADINAVNDEARIARRGLAQLNLPTLPDGWGEIKQGQTQSGFPDLVFRSPILPGERHIVVQIEADRGSVSKQFLANIGISVTADDFVEDQEETAGQPAWIRYAKVLGKSVEEMAAGTIAEVSQNSGVGRSALAAVKVRQAKSFGLPLHYATGYVTSYIGVRTKRVGPEALQILIDTLTPIVIAAYEDLLLDVAGS